MLRGYKADIERKGGKGRGKSDKGRGNGDKGRGDKGRGKGDERPAGKRKGDMIHGAACKRPAVADNITNHQREQRSGHLVKMHGLQDVKLTPYEMVKFKAMIDQPEDHLEVPPESHSEWKALNDLKGNNGAAQRPTPLEEGMEVGPRWGHAAITQHIKKIHAKTIKAISKAIIWQRMVVKLGGVQEAKDALRDKDMYAVTDPMTTPRGSI